MGELDSTTRNIKSPLKLHVAQFCEDKGSTSKRKKEKANRSNASVCDLIHDWKQDSGTITVIIQIGAGIDNRSVEITLEDQHLSVVLLDGRKMQIHLFGCVLPESKAVSFKTNRCTIKLNKTDPLIEWLSLEMPERKLHDKSKLKLDTVVAKGEILKAEKEHLENEKDNTVLVAVVNPKTNIVEREGNQTLRAYLYVKSIRKESLIVDFEEDSFRVQFSTSDSKFLSQYENASKDTVFEWPVKLKGKLQKDECNFKLVSANLEIIMKKSCITTWGVLSPTEENKGMKEDIKKDKWLQLSTSTASSSIIPPAPPSPPSFNGVKKSSWLVSNACRTNTNVGSTSRMAYASDNRVGVRTKGMTGLENIGNTCFMNSVLQCLINTSELREYFLGNYYQLDLNKDNPLGMGGSLAKAFDSLMKIVWSGEQRSMAPGELKRVMSMKANQFSGYAQHDSQEFMIELLDGLHEDLNRIKKKPYIAEPPDLEGWSDFDAAEESWRLNKSRNDSIIDDLFKGQFKSTLQCHTCKKVSLKFDEFCCLSVPIPKDVKVISVIFHWRDTSRKPARIVCHIVADAMAEELLQLLSQKTGVHTKCIKIIEAVDSKINKKVEPRSILATVSVNDKIMAFEVTPFTNRDDPILELAVTQRKITPVPPTICAYCTRKAVGAKLRRCKNCYRVGYCNAECQENHMIAHRGRCKLQPEYVGSPFIISLPESESTYTNLSRIMESYARFSVDIFQPPVAQSRKRRSGGSDGEMSSETEDMEVDSEEEHESCLPKAKRSSVYFGEERAEEDWGTVRRRHSGSVSSNSSGEEELSPAVLVNNLTRSPVPHKAVNCAKTLFTIRPVTTRGGIGGDPLIDQGSQQIDLSDYQYLYMDWNNNDSMPVHCFVQNKDIDCESSNEEEFVLRDKQTSIEACIDLFTRPENLSEDDSWKCPRCKKPVEATKQMSLWRLPPILIIQLKRFSFKYVLYSDKIDKFVQYPIKGLNLRPFMSENSQDLNATYDLYGVINHMGRLLGGHYTAFCRTVNSEDTSQSEIDWRLCDDSRVYKVEESLVVHEQAYLLMYRRRDCPFVIDRPLNVVADNSCTDSDADDLREPGDEDDADSFINNLRNATASIEDVEDHPENSCSDDLD